MRPLLLCHQLPCPHGFVVRPGDCVCVSVHQTIDFRLIYCEFMGVRAAFFSLLNDRAVITSTSHTNLSNICTQFDHLV